MLFKKITYQELRNYGREKLSKSKGTSTQTLNETQQRRKAKLSLEKRSVNQILLCICGIPKQCKAEPNTEKLKP